MLRQYALLATVLLPAALVVVGCSGKVDNSTSVQQGQGGGASGSGGSGQGGTLPGDGSAEGSDSGKCVEIDLSTYNVSCTQAADCLQVNPGPVCDGYTCLCPYGATINVSEKGRYEAEFAAVHPGSGPHCSCPAFPGPECIEGVCLVCLGYPSDPPGCHSADSGPDGALCVEVDLSTYDVSCQTVADCLEVSSGLLCPGSCMCKGSAINASESLRYHNATSGVDSGVACPCPYYGPLACSQNKCILCGHDPNPPPGCPSAN